MSTVLWSNELVGEVVTSDESDKYALYKHADKLDEISQRIAQKFFNSLCDTTDVEFNFGDVEFPNGMTSTYELMAKNGKWMAASEAVSLISSLIAEIEMKKIRFGLLKNDHEAVLAELKESLIYAQGTAAKGGKFNFSVVM